MSQSEKMNIVSALLTDMTGRDKIIRTCSFTAGFLATFSHGENSVKLRTIQSQLSACRVVFRLFADLPMYMYAKNSQWGKSSVKAKVCKKLKCIFILIGKNK